MSSKDGRVILADERTATSLDKRIGARMRARRLEIGMSQDRLGEMLGITFQQVQKYEKGVNRIAASRLCNISEALDIPIQSFFDTSRVLNGKKGGEALDGALTTPGAIELVTLFASIKNTALRRRVLDLVRAMTDA